MASCFQEWLRSLKNVHVPVWLTTRGPLDKVSSAFSCKVETLDSQSPAASLHILVVEKDLYGVVLDNMLDLEMAIGLCTARGAILTDALGSARAKDLKANILVAETTRSQILQFCR